MRAKNAKLQKDLRIALARLEMMSASKTEKPEVSDDALKATVENLKSEKLSLESEKTKALDKVAEIESALKVEKEEVSRLKKEVANMTLLYEVGKKARLGFLETTKRIWVEGRGFVHFNGGTPNVSVIDARNDAVHQGNFSADNAIVFQKPLDRDLIVQFKTVYGMPDHSRIVSVPMRTIINLKGTMTACYSGTEYTHSKEDDRTFDRLQIESWSIYNGLMSVVPVDEAAVRKQFRENKVVHENIASMKLIADKFVKSERKRQRRRVGAD